MKERKLSKTPTKDDARQVLESGLNQMKPVVDVVAMSELEACVYRRVYSEMVSERVSRKENLDQITEFGFLIRVGD